MSQRKLFGSNSMKARVALASLAVLLVGWLVAPRARQTSLTPPQERAAPLIEQQTIARESTQRFDGVQHVRERVRDRLVAILAVAEAGIQTRRDYESPSPQATTASGFGVGVSAAGEILTHQAALAGRTTVSVSADGITATARLSAYEPDTGLVLLVVDDWTGGSTPQFAATPAAPGALVVALGHLDDRDSVAPAFVTHATPTSYAIAPVGPPLLPGTPVYSARGELLAISGREGTALPARLALQRLRLPANAGLSLPASLGMVFQSRDGALAQAFIQSGALVSDVIGGGPADAVGIVPGDVLTAIGDSLIDSADAAHRAIVSLPLGTAVSVRVHRNERSLTFDVQPVSAFEIATREQPRDQATVVTAGELMSEEILRAAALTADAAVISINQRPVVTAAGARRELTRGRGPALLYLRNREGQRFFAVVNQAS